MVQAKEDCVGTQAMGMKVGKGEQSDLSAMLLHADVLHEEENQPKDTSGMEYTRPNEDMGRVCPEDLQWCINMQYLLSVLC